MPIPIKIIVFLISSGCLVYISRASLRDPLRASPRAPLRAPRSHGFYRFFAWECILVLFLLNTDAWFIQPFSWHQLISWFLLVSSLVPLAFGLHSLISRGKPVKHREGESHLQAFEKTTVLITTGIFQFIRHPLYSSLFFLTWGIFFKKPGLPALLLALAAALFLVATAKADEAECVRFFGTSYQAYMKRTKMFIPFLF